MKALQGPNSVKQLFLSANYLPMNELSKFIRLALQLNMRNLCFESREKPNYRNLNEGQYCQSLRLHYMKYYAKMLQVALINRTEHLRHSPLFVLQHMLEMLDTEG